MNRYMNLNSHYIEFGLQPVYYIGDFEISQNIIWITASCKGCTILKGGNQIVSIELSYPNMERMGLKIYNSKETAKNAMWDNGVIIK